MLMIVMRDQWLIVMCTFVVPASQRFPTAVLQPDTAAHRSRRRRGVLFVHPHCMLREVTLRTLVRHLVPLGHCIVLSWASSDSEVLSVDKYDNKGGILV